MMIFYQMRRSGIFRIYYNHETLSSIITNRMSNVNVYIANESLGSLLLKFILLSFNFFLD